MTIEENLNEVEQDFKLFSDNIGIILDGFKNSIYALKQEIEKKQKTDEEIGPSGLWKPKEGENYYYIGAGIIHTQMWTGDDIDKFLYEIGNCFRTEEEAMKVRECLKIRRQLKDIAARLNKGREIDWKDGEQQKHYISYNAIAEMAAQYTNVLQKTPDVVYCLDDNFLGAAIAEIGEERLREYLKEC